MKHLTLILALVLIACASWGASVAAPETPAILTDNSGNDTRTTPLNVAVSSATISLPTAPAGTTTGSTLNLTAGATSAAVTALSGRDVIAVFNLATSTVWLSISAGTATVSQGIPVYSGGYWSDNIGAGVSVNYVASTPTAISVYQGAY